MHTTHRAAHNRFYLNDNQYLSDRTEKLLKPFQFINENKEFETMKCKVVNNIYTHYLSNQYYKIVPNRFVLDALNT